ncbi:hypothetical protein K492DRAFT_176753 [Lichtheimia hyalospora FSU 10163]|nr:hypothetical protein K492DRAFT_176753 [Lichtheimia hyalospora FSU 10163]
MSVVAKVICRCSLWLLCRSKLGTIGVKTDLKALAHLASRDRVSRKQQGPSSWLVYHSCIMGIRNGGLCLKRQ